MSVRGRFAPSPSGRMHLGNLYTALLSYLNVRRQDGSWILRIEDLDPQRSKAEFARLIEDDLLWLGLKWDEGGLENHGDSGPYVQSQRFDLYADALNRLKDLGVVYPCTCTRAEIMATQAPHQSDGRVIYSRNCCPDGMPRQVDEPESPHASRLWVPDRKITFTDAIAGPQSFNLAHDCGDFVLRRADGAWAYQLAVVVDDALMGITEVVRGSDLLLSTAQQLYLYELLGYRPPRFAHLPLVTNAEGVRLSKRDKSLNMEYLRAHHTPNEVLGQLGVLSGLLPTYRPVELAELAELFASSFSNRFVNW